MATKQILSPLPGTFYRKPAPDKPERVRGGWFEEVAERVCNSRATAADAAPWTTDVPGLPRAGR